MKAHNCAKALNGILDAQQKLKADFLKEVNNRLSKHPSENAPAQISLIKARLETELGRNEAQVMAFIEKTEKLHERFKAAEEFTKQLAVRVIPLKELRGIDNVILENLLYFADMPLGAPNGDVLASASSDLVSGSVRVAAGMTFDKLTGAVLDKTLLM